MTYTEDLIKEVRGFGALNYTLDNILRILYPKERLEFIADFNNPEHPLSIAYQKGKTAAKYNIDKKIYSLANEGDIDSIKLRNETKQTDELDALIKDRFNV